MSEEPSVPAVVRSVIGVVAERGDRECRVALVPVAVTTLVSAGHEVLVEAGAGVSASFTDDAYVSAGARVTSRSDVLSTSQVLLTVGSLAADGLHTGQTVIGLLDPVAHTSSMDDYAAGGVQAISLEGLPRTASRAQSMDVLTSQANVAGYKAAVVAADTFPGYFPMLMTAAGTVRPATVLVIGAGVAGLQAIGTAKRLGAVVQGYDVRPAAQADIASVGATCLVLATATDAAGDDGYARALTADETAAQQSELAEVIGRTDVVICTAQTHGHAPPELVTEEAIGRMRPGSVLIDLAASDLGGNVHGSEPGRTVVTDAGVTVVGASDLPSQMPAAASTAYAKNLCALLAFLDTGSGIVIDLQDEIQAGIVVVHDGHVREPSHPATPDPAIPSEEEHHELQPVR